MPQVPRSIKTLGGSGDAGEGVSSPQRRGMTGEWFASVWNRGFGSPGEEYGKKRVGGEFS